MKRIISNITKTGLFALALAGAVSCNKEDELTKAVSIEITGFNAGNTELEVSIDTVVYRNFKTASNTELNFGRIFTSPSSQKEAVLKIKDVISGREVYQQQISLNSSGLEQYFPFVLIDGNPLEIKPPAADPATNKLTFYIHYPTSSDPIDIFIRNSEGQISYLAQNVQTSTWITANYLHQPGFDEPSTNDRVYFTKAGTTDVWAFNENEYMSQVPASTLFLPKPDQKGRVCSYFVSPGSVDLRAVRLFKRPV